MVQYLKEANTVSPNTNKLFTLSSPTPEGPIDAQLLRQQLTLEKISRGFKYQYKHIFFTLNTC